MIEIYTDGSCGANKGNGASAFVVVKNKEVLYKYSIGWSNTTINRCELMAIILGMVHASRHYPGQAITIISDSQYCVYCAIGEYRIKQNVDLWDVFNKFAYQWIEFKWIKGHNNNRFNDMADALCQSTPRMLRDKKGNDSLQGVIQEILNEEVNLPKHVHIIPRDTGKDETLTAKTLPTLKPLASSIRKRQETCSDERRICDSCAFCEFFKPLYREKQYFAGICQNRGEHCVSVEVCNRFQRVVDSIEEDDFLIAYRGA